MRLWGGLACAIHFAMVLAGCRPQPDSSAARIESGAEASARASSAASWPPFRARGRWEDPRAIRYRIDATSGPLPRAQFVAAVESAVSRWNATGCVALTPTEMPDADLTLGWRSKQHDDCEPFGVGGAVAHSGPVGHGAFVHFDAERAYRPNGSGPMSLACVAVHEIGHALGLDHVEDERSVMSTSPLRPCEPGSGDVAGLHSLYGGGDDDESDVWILGADGTTRATLRRIAPNGHTEIGWIDSDGDGRDELLSWRTDVAGHGALTIHAFDSSVRLVRTSGPFVGAVLPGAVTRAVRTDRGDCLLVSELADGRRKASLLTRAGELEPYEGEPPPTSGTAAPPDFDGDGIPETVTRLRTPR